MNANMKSKMKMSMRMLLIMSLVLLIVLAGCKTQPDSSDSQNSIDTQDDIRLGYCPTMQNRANAISLENRNVEIVAFDSTAGAISALNNGIVDAVIVGRLASSTELDNTFELRLRDGLTLVGKEKKMIHANDLSSLRIHTYVSEEEVMQYIPATANVIYHDSIELALEEGINDAILIDWDDYLKHYGRIDLVIPVDDEMNKIEKFRIPVIYSYDQDVLEALVLSIDKS